MSIIHVNQIKTKATKLFDGLIDVRDATKAAKEHQENVFLSRALAAYAVHYLAEAEPVQAAAAITDGGDDNGIDAVYYSEKIKRLYVVQSKWIHDGIGEPASGDVKKFLCGVRDLFNMKFDRFNAKLRAHESDIKQALNDPGTRYELVLVHTGASSLATHSQRDLDDILIEMNDTSEMVFGTVLNQGDLHASLTAAVAGEPINLEIGLKSWGKKESPHLAFYGQLSGRQIAEWWSKYRTRLFTRNLRSILGDTEVNAEIRETLEKRPDDFWYFNNGVTILARRAQRTMAGGSDNDFSTFHCEDISVVNGAQTVGTIGKFGENNLDRVENVSVPVRIIVRGENENFAEWVTRTNNTQNRIDGRDFAALDPEQTRIRIELAIDGIEYQIMRTEAFVRTETSFDLGEATTALACSSGKVRLAVQLKREIGKLWEDISKAPYKELFNPSVTGLHVWRSVQIQRRIDRAVDTYVKRTRNPAHYGVSTHGNRLVSALVFDALPMKVTRTVGSNIDEVISESQITDLVDRCLMALAAQLDKHYPNSIIPTLFKNLKKCEHLFNEVKKALSASK